MSCVALTGQIRGSSSGKRSRKSPPGVLTLGFMMWMVTEAWVALMSFDQRVEVGSKEWGPRVPRFGGEITRGGQRGGGGGRGGCAASAASRRSRSLIHATCARRTSRRSRTSTRRGPCAPRDDALLLLRRRARRLERACRLQRGDPHGEGAALAEAEEAIEGRARLRQRRRRHRQMPRRRMLHCRSRGPPPTRSLAASHTSFGRKGVCTEARSREYRII